MEQYYSPQQYRTALLEELSAGGCDREGVPVVPLPAPSFSVRRRAADAPREPDRDAKGCVKVSSSLLLDSNGPCDSCQPCPHHHSLIVSFVDACIAHGMPDDVIAEQVQFMANSMQEVIDLHAALQERYQRDRLREYQLSALTNEVSRHERLRLQDRQAAHEMVENAHAGYFASLQDRDTAAPRVTARGTGDGLSAEDRHLASPMQSWRTAAAQSTVENGAHSLRGSVGGSPALGKQSPPGSATWEAPAAFPLVAAVGSPRRPSPLRYGQQPLRRPNAGGAVPETYAALDELTSPAGIYPAYRDVAYAGDTTTPTRRNRGNANPREGGRQSLRECERTRLGFSPTTEKENIFTPLRNSPRGDRDGCTGPGGHAAASQRAASREKRLSQQPLPQQQQSYWRPTHASLARAASSQSSTAAQSPALSSQTPQQSSFAGASAGGRRAKKNTLPVFRPTRSSSLRAQATELRMTSAEAPQEADSAQAPLRAAPQPSGTQQTLLSDPASLTPPPRLSIEKPEEHGSTLDSASQRTSDDANATSNEMAQTSRPSAREDGPRSPSVTTSARPLSQRPRASARAPPLTTHDAQLSVSHPYLYRRDRALQPPLTSPELQLFIEMSQRHIREAEHLMNSTRNDSFSISERVTSGTPPAVSRVDSTTFTVFVSPHEDEKGGKKKALYERSPMVEISPTSSDESD